MRWATFSKVVMWEQTLFGLPWVMTSICIAWIGAAYTGENSSLSLLLLTQMMIAFLSARIAGMAFNRVVDREIDARNPRTRFRVLPIGEASSSQVLALGLVSLGIFIAACAAINVYCLCLAPIATGLLWLYSYTKRFTPLCHFVLGCVYFLIPLFVWAALCNSLSVIPFLLGAAMMVSIVASDIVYALLDVEFDKSYGLHSMPLVLGIRKAILFAKALHGLAVGILFVVGVLISANAMYFAGVIATAGVYLLSYMQMRPEVPERIHEFLAVTNRRGALTFLVFSIGSVLWQRWS